MLAIGTITQTLTAISGRAQLLLRDRRDLNDRIVVVAVAGMQLSAATLSRRPVNVRGLVCSKQNQPQFEAWHGDAEHEATAPSLLAGRCKSWVLVPIKDDVNEPVVTMSALAAELVATCLCFLHDPPRVADLSHHAYLDIGQPMTLAKSFDEPRLRLPFG